jgi:hypothetical protein
VATKTDDNGPFKEFDFEEWLRDGFKGMRSEFKGRKVQFDTSNFRTHLRNASKEQLLAVRSLIDSAIEFIDKQEATSKKA